MKNNKGKKSFAILRRFWFFQLPVLLAAVLLNGSLQAQAKKPANDNVCGVTKEETAEISRVVQLNMFKLKAQGKLDFKRYKNADESGQLLQNKTAASSVLFRWPLTTAAYRDFPSWSIHNFVDLDPDGDGDDDDREDFEIEDYNCGNRTYDGHQGIDILVHPYRWELKNNGFVHVIAAARGIIVFKHQGEFDENCGDLSNYQGSTARGNNLVILHEDGTTASFYMHMKDGSLTAKVEGDFIETGEYIGTVASAGRSSEPHLHYQVNTGYIDQVSGDNSGTRIDPFANGSCTISASTSWISELPYNDPAVLTLETHSTAPGSYTDVCDKTIDLYFDNSFYPGETIYFRSKLRDWVNGSTITHTIYKPDGTVWKSYNRTNPSASRNYFPADQPYTVSIYDPAGTYRYAVTFGGKTYSHYFTIICQENKTVSGAATKHAGYMVSNTITSTQTMAGSNANYLKYMADQKVVLNPGFRAASGCRFVANTLGCSNSANGSAARQSEEAEKLPVKANSTVNEPARFTIFPNPSQGQFMVKYQSAKPFEGVVSVKNLFGQEVFRSPLKINQNQLIEQVDLRKFSKGVYIVALVSGDKTTSQKIIIQ